jgi:hypothetical protein
VKQIALTLCAFTLVVGACSSDESATTDAVASLDETPTTTSSTTPAEANADADEAILAYVQCLRDEGLDLQDPDLSDDGGLGLRRQFADEGEEISQEVEAAFDACDDMRDGVATRFENVDTSDTEDRLLAFSQCMRDGGVADFPDPDLSVWEPGAGLGPGNGPFGTTLSDMKTAGIGQDVVASCQASFGGPGTGSGGGE